MGETIDIDKDGNPLTYGDIICSEDTSLEDLDMKMHIDRAIFLLNHLLDKREREIIILRYGLDGGVPLTQREISKKLGISRSYVSRLEKAALEKIGEHLRLSGC